MICQWQVRLLWFTVFSHDQWDLKEQQFELIDDLLGNVYHTKMIIDFVFELLKHPTKLIFSFFSSCAHDMLKYVCMVKSLLGIDAQFLNAHDLRVCVCYSVQCSMV